MACSSEVRSGSRYDKPVTISKQHHRERLLEQVMGSTNYSDVTFLVEGRTIQCHKVIMASACDYFQELFYGKLKACTEIPISIMSYESFNSLKTFIYTGQVQFSRESAFDLLEMAIDIGYRDLLSPLEDYFAEQFQQIQKSEKYFKLSKAAIKCVLAHPDLVESSEELICTHLLKWLEHSPDQRYQCMNELLLSLRLECLAPEFIQYTLLTHPSLVRNADAVEKLLWMLKHIIFNDSVPPFVKNHLPRTKTDVCNGLAIINMSNGMKVMYFGFRNRDCIQLMTQKSGPLQKKLYLTGAQACAINNRVYAASNAFDFVTLDMDVLGYAPSSDIRVSYKFILAAGRTNELVLINDNSLKKYFFPHKKWIPLINARASSTTQPPQSLFSYGHNKETYTFDYTNTFSFDRKEDVEWYIQKPQERDQNTYGALIDSGTLYIFGVRKNTTQTGGNGNSAPVHILRLRSANEDPHALTMTLPQPVRHMQVVAYKEHVILAGSDNTYIIKLEDLQKCPKAVDTDSTSESIEEQAGNELGDKEVQDAELEDKEMTDSKTKTSLQNTFQVVTSITSSGSEQHISLPTEFKMCRVGNQLIKLADSKSLTEIYWGVSYKYQTFWAVDIEDVINNTEGVHWRRIGDVPKDVTETLRKGDFALVPFKFSKK